MNGWWCDNELLSSEGKFYNVEAPVFTFLTLFLLTHVSLSSSIKKREKSYSSCNVLLTGNVTYGQDQDCVLTVPLTVWPFLGKSLNICDAHLKNGNSCIITGPTTSLWGLNEIIMHGKHLGQCLALGRFPNASLSYHSKWIPPPTPNVLVRDSINLYVFQKLPLFGSMCHWLTGYFIVTRGPKLTKNILPS